MKKEQQLYQISSMESPLVFRAIEQSKRKPLNRKIVGATAVFGSISMLMSVAPIQTFATVTTGKESATTQSKSIVEHSSTASKEKVAEETSTTVTQTEDTAKKETASSSNTNSESSTTDTTAEEIVHPVPNETDGTTDTHEDETSSSEKNDVSTDESDKKDPEGSENAQEKPETPTAPSEEQPIKDEDKEETQKAPVTPSVATPASETPKTDVVSTSVVETPAEAPIEKEDFSSYWSDVQTPTGNTTSSGAIQYDKNETTEAFIEKIGDSARKIGQDNDLYASVMMAQAILESGSGSSSLSQEPHYNLFGIKGAHEGHSVSYSTQEDDGSGNLNTIQAEFRSYNNYEESFEDYATLMKEGIAGNSNFYEGVWKSSTSNYEDATKFLTGKYATDTQYNQKLNGLIETYNLTQYDHEKEDQVPTTLAHSLASSGYMIPVANYTISSPFGGRGNEFHRGLDLAATQGEPVSASRAGKVITAEIHPSWGNYVVVLHDDGSTTLYAHLSEIKASVNQEVAQGQVVGLVGSTGNSTGPHLHFEVCTDASLLQSKLVDPQPILFGK